jgi:rhomboid family protein
VNINIPPATQALILVNVVVYFLMMLVGSGPFTYLALWPLGSGAFWPWEVVTYAFLHSGLTHILFNMFALFMFGGEIERLFGSRWFVTYFFVCVITAAIAQLIVASVLGEIYPTVGASGGIFGILLAYAMYFPHRKLIIIPIPVPMPAWLLVTGYGVIELYLGFRGLQPGVAHFAHLGGMVGGFIMILHRRGWRL